MVSKVNASMLVSAKAFFTMIALVEKRNAPTKAMRKPVKLMEFFSRRKGRGFRVLSLKFWV